MDFTTSQASFAEALLHANRPLPPGVTTARGTPVASRFAVYRNNVYVGLVNALAKRFPVTQRLVGEEFFRGMARVYAQETKPASPLILDYGDDFPEFVASFGPATSLLYLADVARLEAAWMTTYHAADAAPLKLDELASVSPERLMQARLAPHPAVRLVSSVHAIGSIWLAHQAPDVTPLATNAAESVLLVRPALEVSLHVLPARDQIFATALLAGENLAAAAENALAAFPDFEFGTALVGLVSLGAFRRIVENEETCRDQRNH